MQPLVLKLSILYGPSSLKLLLVQVKPGYSYSVT
jgi:hypothetical protein